MPTTISQEAISILMGLAQKYVISIFWREYIFPQTILNIEAIEPAGRKALGIGAVRVVAAQPVNEIVRAALDRAHPVRAYIQQVAVKGGGIGDAEPEIPTRIDQGRGHAPFGQTRGRHGAGESAADYDDLVA